MEIKKLIKSILIQDFNKYEQRFISIDLNLNKNNN